MLRHRVLRNLLPVLSAARHATFSASLTRFFAGPFVSGALQVRRFAALAGNLMLLSPIHRCKSAILFGHFHTLVNVTSPPAGVDDRLLGDRTAVQPMCRDEPEVSAIRSLCGRMCSRVRPTCCSK
jgi:hypothetical protein